MARLYDRLMAGGYQAFAPDALLYQTQGAMAAMEHAHVVVADNVERYWEELGGSVRSFVKDIERNIPKVVSPVSPAFYEAIARGPASADVSSFGALSINHDLDTPEGSAILESPIYQPGRHGLRLTDVDGVFAGDATRDGARFVTEWWLFYEPRPNGRLVTRSKRPAVLGLYLMPARADGSPFVDAPHPLRRTVSFAGAGGAFETAAALTSGMRWVLPLQLAVSFMHCKNVEKREMVPRYIERKPWQKKHGRPLVRYHVLDIDPMRKVLRDEGGSEETGLKRALHICRGHFAHYPDGLFGRGESETVWRPQHIRGSAKQGAVVKDYNVKAPR
jgi:hypothetical protein